MTMTMTTTTTNAAAVRSVLVWDLPTRVFHWALVALVVVSWLTGEEENFAALHRYSGEAIAGLVVFRVIWGFAGGEHARFSGSAMRIRDRLKTMPGGTIALGFAGNPQEPSAMRGGPIFELLFCLRTQLKREKKLGKFKFIFFSPATRPGERLGPRAVDSLLARMRALKIETHLGAGLLRFEPGKIVTEKTEIPADLILYMPGMTGPDWVGASGLALTGSGHFKADAMARVDGAERVYAVGDGAAFPGPEWQAKQAHAADLQAAAAAANLLDELNGRTPLRVFKHEIICIVDMLDKGMLVFRDDKRALALPPTVLAHWAKVVFENRYLAKLSS